jgi:hypothetical protein
MPYVLLALLGLVLWLGAAVGFCQVGLDAQLRLRKSPALGAGILFLFGVALFVTGLRLA